MTTLEKRNAGLCDSFQDIKRGRDKGAERVRYTLLLRPSKALEVLQFEARKHGYHCTSWWGILSSNSAYTPFNTQTLLNTGHCQEKSFQTLKEGKNSDM
jgi:hypothetical protein